MGLKVAGIFMRKSRKEVPEFKSFYEDLFKTATLAQRQMRIEKLSDRPKHIELWYITNIACQIARK